MTGSVVSGELSQGCFSPVFSNIHHVSTHYLLTEESRFLRWICHDLICFFDNVSLVWKQSAFLQTMSPDGRDWGITLFEQRVLWGLQTSFSQHMNWETEGTFPPSSPFLMPLGPVSLVPNILKFAEAYRDAKLNVYSFWHPISRSWVVQEAPWAWPFSLTVCSLNRLGNSTDPRGVSSHWGCLAWAALCGLLFAHLPFQQGGLESLFCLRMGANILKVPHHPAPKRLLFNLDVYLFGEGQVWDI